jgi:Putative zinc dependent peptidase (DUF5700)
MKNLIIVLTLTYLSLLNLNGQEISITYDYSAVKKLIEIFDKGELLESDFNELVELNGSKAYLKKLGTFFSGIDKSSFKKSLEAATKGVPLENDPFMFERVLKSIPTAKKLLTNVMMQKDELTKNSTSLLGQYSPENIKIEVTVYMILGITGGGWTFDSDPNSFYVDFSSMKDDINGLTYLSAHELFHLIQYRFMKPAPNKSKKVEYLLDQMLREGSATYVADFTKLSVSGSYVDFSKKQYERNFRRMESNFAMFEALVYQANYDPISKIDLLYNIGLSGMYQSPLYYVGYHMIKLIEKYSGREELIALLKKPPNKLILAYNELCIKHKNVDNDFITLSKSTIEVLELLDK